VLLIVVHRPSQTMQDRDKLSHAEPQRRKGKKEKGERGNEKKIDLFASSSLIFFALRLCGSA
jgi:hypothetical protein